MGLDPRGYIAIGEIVLYVPVVVIAGFLVFQHGAGRKAGWMFLVILSIIRIVGGVMHVVSETVSHPSTTIFIITSVLESAGLSPLTLATLGFLNTTAQQSFDDTPLISHGTRLLGLLNTAALALTIIGGVKAGTAKDIDQVNSGATLRHVGVILFMVLFALITLLHGFFWSHKKKIMKYRRSLLAGISIALPFLFVRVLFSVLSGFSPVGVPGGPPPDKTVLSQFNSTTGSYYIYLVMSVIMELAVVAIYIYVGITIPVQKDYTMGKMESGYDSDVELAPGHAGYYNRP